MTTLDPAAVERGVRSALLEVLDAGGDYGATRAAILEAISTGVERAVSERLAVVDAPGGVILAAVVMGAREATASYLPSLAELADEDT